eukprot:984164-Rhodomonas_salina.1
METCFNFVPWYRVAGMRHRDGEEFTPCCESHLCAMGSSFDPCRLICNLPPDLWLLVLKSFDLKSLCCLGATSKLTQEVAFKPDLEQWKLIRLPKCTSKKAAAFLRMGGDACKQFDCSSYSQISDDTLAIAAAHCRNLTVFPNLLHFSWPATLTDSCDAG